MYVLFLLSFVSLGFATAYMGFSPVDLEFWWVIISATIGSTAAKFSD